MKNKNFDSISKFSVPQSWIDAAKNVPQTNKKKAVVVIGFKRYLQAVACLVTVIGLTLLVLFMRENEVKPRPGVQNTTSNSQTTTTEDGTSDDTLSTQSTDGTGKDYFDRLPIIIETTPDGTIIIRPTTPQESVDPSEPIGPQPPTSETEDPTQLPTIEPSEPQLPPDEPTDPPTDAPTNPPTTKPWYPVEPTDEPTYDPTEEPWDPIEPTEGPWDPVEPTNPPTTPPTKPPVIEPTDPPNISPDKIRLIAKVKVLKSDLKGNYNIYCKVYNHRSEFCGDPSLYSQQHKVYIIPDDNPRYVTLYYEVKRADLGVYDSYKFIFYNSSGEVVSATLRYTIY